MNFLEEIIHHKRTELEEKKAATPTDELKTLARRRAQGPHFLQALRSCGMGLIAEVKHKSPSAGPIRDPFEPASIAADYEAAGAQAVSVLMDEQYFGGGEEHFRAVRERIELPMLYKEFVVDPWQVWHAASLGASAVLLIAGALTDQDIDTLLEVCLSARIEPLVEVHDEGELTRLREWKLRCIGINNRNLRTFETTLETTYRLKDMVPDDVTLISESGIRTSDDVMALKSAGIHAVLVGEHLLRSPELQDAVKELMGKAWGSL